MLELWHALRGEPAPDAVLRDKVAEEVEKASAALDPAASVEMPELRLLHEIDPAIAPRP